MYKKKLNAGLLGIAADNELLTNEELMPHVRARIEREIEWQKWVESFPCNGDVITIDVRKTPCDWGCGRPGVHWKQHHKKWCCSQMAYHCPSFKTNQGKRIIEAKKKKRA